MQVVRRGKSGFRIDADCMLVNKLSSQNTGEHDENCGNNRHVKTPRLHQLSGVLPAQQPIERREGQHHHCQQRMAPGSHQMSDRAHADQIDKPHQTRKPTSPGADSAQPEASARPKNIMGKNKRAVGGHQAQQGGYWKVNQCRVDGMARNGHATADIFLGHQFLLRVKQVFLAVALGFCVTACDGPQSALEPAGSAAQAAAALWWGMFGVAALVLVVVVAAWLYAMVRKPTAVDELQSRRIGRRWMVGGGLVLPMVSIILLLAFGIPAGLRMLPLPVQNGEPLVIEVIGHQWWWEVHYPSSGITTANELHLPVDVPVNVQVTSSDVIHSFWIPKLGGKIDMVPGRTHTHRLIASETGSMRGQCSEFCGKFHAHMVLAVEVHSQADFAAWRRVRAQPLNEATRRDPTAETFRQHCGNCHRVAGVSEGGLAPDLTTVAGRPFLGGRPADQIQSIAEWLKNYPRAKHSNAPDHGELAPDQLDDIGAWLEDLGDE